MKITHIPILMYHSIDKQSEDYLTVSQEQFHIQISHLAENYSIILLRDVSQFQAEVAALPPNPVILSFDDSLKDSMEYALPVLNEFGAKALFFAIAGYLGQTNAWNHKAYRFSEHMTPGDLVALHNSGHEVGSHTLTHQRLTKLSDDALRLEYEQSRQILTDILGTVPIALSYPYGGFDDRTARLAAQYYTFAFSSARDGFFDWTVDPMKIRRLFVAPRDGPAELDKNIANYRRGIPHA